MKKIGEEIFPEFDYRDEREREIMCAMPFPSRPAFLFPPNWTKGPGR